MTDLLASDAPCAAELIAEITMRLDARLRAVGSALLDDEVTHAQFREQVARILTLSMIDIGLIEPSRRRDAGSAGGITGRLRALHDIHPRMSLEAAGQLFEIALPVLVAAVARECGPAHADVSEIAVSLNKRLFSTMSAASVGYVGVMLGRISKVQSEERRSLARELHDNVAQSIAGATMRLELSAQPGADPEGRMRGDAVGILKETLADVQSIAVELRQHVGDRALTAALHDFIETAGLTQTVHLHIGPALGELAEQHREETFLIVREAIRNAVAHAQASRVDVHIDDDSVHADGRHLIVTVRDDGQGFELAAKNDHRRMGLVGMRERAELIGAEFELESTPGYGTTVTVRVRATGAPA